jgi:hypothetical protein
MPMNAPERTEALRQTDQVKEHRGNPGVDTVPQELCPDEQIPPWNPVKSHVLDERPSETFADGAGI